MTRERIIERVRKLLALSNSSNEHEAALAAAHAQRLLAEHNLAMSELELQAEGAGEAELVVAKTVAKWLSSLFATVANAFDCFPIVTTNQDNRKKKKKCRISSSSLKNRPQRYCSKQNFPKK